jgi:hypothetical protein
MKVHISFENCDLEIAHIGTRIQIAIQETQEAAHVLADALVSLGKTISEALLDVVKCINDLIRPALKLDVMPGTMPRHIEINGAIRSEKIRQKSIDRIAWKAEAAQRLAKRGGWK